MEPARAGRDRQVGPGLVAGPGRLPGVRRPSRPPTQRIRGLAARRLVRPAAVAGAAAALILISGCAGAPGANSARTGPAGAGASAGAGAAGAALAGRSSPARTTADPRTSCRSVVYLGDATSEGMMSALYLPDPAQRLDAQDHDVGVRTVTASIIDANSVADALSGPADGFQAAGSEARGSRAGGSRAGGSGAARRPATGSRDCWVVALGTNDTAAVAAGSGTGRLARIEDMMSAARGRPVLWVNVISLLSAGPYSEASMQRWNQTLRQACARYPNMRIFDWASVVRMRWFLNDGIRYTSGGYASRARQIAKALARAFPVTGHSNGCAVS
jgi:hypothetical protein